MAALDLLVPEHNIRDLQRLLARLQRTISHEDSISVTPAFRNRYFKQKYYTNFEHSRALLLRLEHESANIKVASRKQAVQEELACLREEVKKLQSIVQEAEEAEAREQDVAERPREFENNIGGQTRLNPGTESAVVDTPTNEIGGGASRLRSRNGALKPSSTKTTGYFHGAAEPAINVIHEREKILDENRMEQEDIMASLLYLTQNLKANATVFQGSLEDEKAVLDLASRGLERNVDSMGAAARTLGTLRRMSEGKGWFGRIQLWAYITVLYVLLLLVLFLAPRIMR